MIRILIATALLCAIWGTPAAATEADPRIGTMMQLIKAKAPSAPIIKACTTENVDLTGDCTEWISVTIGQHGVPTLTVQASGHVFDTEHNAHEVIYVFKDVGITGTLTHATVIHLRAPIVRDPLFPALRQELYEHALDGALDFMLEELTKKQ